jgi:sugar O-acyltransferase (sialic acid O-acetyltransferase NeuD family)
MNGLSEIVVVGGGGHAKELISVLKKTGAYRIVGYTDEQDKGPILGIPYLGNDSVLSEIKAKNHSCRAAIGLGTVGKSEGRRRLQALLDKMGLDLPVIISKHAIVAEEVNLGKGTVVFDGAVVNSGTTIGGCGIINTNSTVEHDCRIEDHVHIATGASVCGGVHIGKNCLIGAGASLVQYVSICPNCIVGAGAVVNKDITEPGTYVGNPARKLR